MAEPAKLIERLQVRMEALRQEFRALSVEDDYRYMFDPYWVRAMPYRVSVKPGTTTEFEVRVRNFRDRPQTHVIELHTPVGLKCETGVLKGTINDVGTLSHTVKLSANKDAKPGTFMVAFDITRDGIRHGELFDFIVNVG